MIVHNYICNVFIKCFCLSEFTSLVKELNPMIPHWNHLNESTTLILCPFVYNIYELICVVYVNINSEGQVYPNPRQAGRSLTLIVSINGLPVGGNFELPPHFVKLRNKCWEKYEEAKRFLEEHRTSRCWRRIFQCGDVKWGKWDGTRRREVKSSEMSAGD